MHQQTFIAPPGRDLPMRPLEATPKSVGGGPARSSTRGQMRLRPRTLDIGRNHRMPLTLKRFTLTALLTFTALVALAGARAATAHADRYHVYACFPWNGTTEGWWTENNAPASMTVYNDCGGEGLVARNVVNGPFAGWLNYAAWKFDPNADGNGNRSIRAFHADVATNEYGWSAGIWDGGNNRWFCADTWSGCQ